MTEDEKTAAIIIIAVSVLLWLFGIMLPGFATLIGWLVIVGFSLVFGVWTLLAVVKAK